MAMNSTGPISLAGTVSGQSVQVENGGNGSSTISMGDVWVRDLADTMTGPISLLSMRGKSHIFYTNITASQANVNLRTLVVNNGWNQFKPVVATIDSGVTIYSSSTASPALTIDGDWNAGVKLINNGMVTGAGGAGGIGGIYSSRGPGAGGAGGPAIQVNSAVSIQNYATIAGGGGGGGGGGSTRYSYTSGKTTAYAYSQGGGGGGGAGTVAGGIAGGSYPGAAGSASVGGNGGNGYASYDPGGKGGNLGTAGNAGDSGNYFGGAGGGAAGNYLQGASLVTWINTGTLLGGVV